jgi:predicted DNA-binding protein (MmcQ/YjbR family)
MDIESLRAYCLSFPDTSEKLQWGDALCFKMGGKMFAVASLDFDAVPRFCFKCTPDTFAELIEREGMAPAPYVGRYHWVGLEALDTLAAREFKELIAISYDLVAAKLPKKRASKKAAPRGSGKVTESALSRQKRERPGVN